MNVGWKVGDTYLPTAKLQEIWSGPLKAFDGDGGGGRAAEEKC